MLKICKFCNNKFSDLTKNKNRKHCGGILCNKEQNRIYRKNIDQTKRKSNQIAFKKNNPNYLKEWREQNREQDRKLNREYRKKRLASDINFKLAHNLRHRLNGAIKNNAKIGSAVDDLGCTVSELKIHLESQFQEGMSWDNYGLHGWHIDHIKPLAEYNLEDREQYKEACNYKNLQPLWAIDNLIKGAKSAL